MTAAIVVGSALLMYLLVTHDYRLHYVWAYSDNLLPLHYLISTFWGGQEGSFLLWIFWGVLLGLPLMRFARSYESRVMVVYNLTLLSLILLLVKQDPFRFHEGLTAAMIPMDGQGLNPLLQNPWMVIHPPIMFIGYASLGIPFAFAIAALWMKTYDEWTKVSMPWVLLSLAIPRDRHHARRLLGLRDPRLGWLLGLGPGRERLAGAVVGDPRPDPRNAAAARAAGASAGSTWCSPSLPSCWWSTPPS